MPRIASVPSLALVVALAFVTGGCQMIADWMCWDVRVELHLDNSQREDWINPRITVAVALLSKNDIPAETVPEFASKTELERWFAQSTVGKERLAAEGRFTEVELELGKGSGLRQVVRLSRGDIEMNDGAKVVVVANFAKRDNQSEHRRTMDLIDDCRFAVELHASARIEDISSKVRQN